MMNSIKNKTAKLLTLAGLVFLASCSFDSDKDYKTYDSDVAADSADHSNQQHHETKPEQDAVHQNDSLSKTVPGAAATADSASKMDSSTIGKPTD